MFATTHGKTFYSLKYTIPKHTHTHTQSLKSSPILLCAPSSDQVLYSPRAMDLVLNVADHYVLTPYVYPASWSEDGTLRQILSLLVLTNLGALVLYLGLGAISYYLVFDHRLMKHPHFLEVWHKTLNLILNSHKKSTLVKKICLCYYSTEKFRVLHYVLISLVIVLFFISFYIYTSIYI